jgi:hypothetical protein
MEEEAGGGGHSVYQRYGFAVSEDRENVRKTHASRKKSPVSAARLAT